MKGLIALVLAFGFLINNNDALRLPPSQSATEPWHIVWKTFHGYETDFVNKQITDHLNIGSITDVTDGLHEIPLKDRTLIVTRFRQSDTKNCDEVANLEQQFQKAGLKHGIMVFGEEGKSCDFCKAVMSNASFVMRHYWHPDCDKYGERLMILPMGVIKTPHIHIRRDTPANERPLLFSFSSSHQLPVRNEMVEQFWRKFKPSQYNFSINYGHVHTKLARTVADLKEAATDRILFFDKTTDDAYMLKLCSSQFSLVPRGNVEDSWRMGETMYCGAIPVVTDGGDYYKHYLPDSVTSKFLTVDADLNAESFQKVFDKIEHLQGNPEALNKHQAELMQAWNDYYEKLKNELKVKLEETA